MAYETVWGVIMNHNLQTAKREVTHTLTAGTTSLTPATASISDMGEPEKLWERAGSPDDWLMMFPKDDLSNFTATDNLLFWKWEGDTFYFIGATGNRQLKIEYLSSGSAPTTGTIPIDGARTVLGFITAAYIANTPLGGQPQLASALFALAYGPSMGPDATGGALRLLINPMIKERQKRPIKIPTFRPRRTWRGQ